MMSGKRADTLECVNSIFEQPWWLDAVAPGKWGCAEVVGNNGEVVARWPYVKQRKFGFRVLGMPPFTQTLGVFYRNSGAKPTNMLGQQKQLLNQLLETLPTGYNIDLNLDHRCHYVLPLFWKGFTVRPYFSYRIERLEDLDFLWANVRGNIRKEVRKAEKQLVIRDDLPLGRLIDMQEKTYRRQGRRPPRLEATLRRLDAELTQRSAKKLMCAVDSSGRIHAADYFAFDKNTLYGIAGGADPALRSSGATSLILWEAIKFASGVSRAFDFRGSVIEDIEYSFRGFGAYPQVYYRVSRLNPALSLAEYMKPRIKKLLKHKV